VKYGSSNLNGIHLVCFILDQCVKLEIPVTLAKISDVIRRNAKSILCGTAVIRFSGAGKNSDSEYSESELWNRDDISTKLVTFKLLY
jgi:hypothetical protein